MQVGASRVVGSRTKEILVTLEVCTSALAVLRPGVKLQYKERVLTLEVCTTSPF